MRSRVVCLGGLILALGVPSGAVAGKSHPRAARQSSKDEPPSEIVPGSVTIEKERPNLRPSLAVVTFAATEKDARLATPVARALAEIATTSDLFSRVVSGDGRRELLKGTGAPADGCRESSCLIALGQQLGVDRLLIAELRSGGISALAFDWASEVLVETALGNALAADLSRHLGPLVAPLLQKLSRPLGEVVVTTNVNGAQIHWGSRLVGSGPFFRGAVPAGTHPVRVTADGYQPFEETITIAPGGKAEVEAELETLSQAVARMQDEFGPGPPAPIPVKPLLRRPGLYAALGGAVALSVGLALGGWTRAVSSRMQDANGDGILDVTLTEALMAKRAAELANAIGTAGIVGMGAGVGWLVLDSGEPTAAPTMGVLVHGQF